MANRPGRPSKGWAKHGTFRAATSILSAQWVLVGHTTPAAAAMRFMRSRGRTDCWLTTNGRSFRYAWLNQDGGVELGELVREQPLPAPIVPAAPVPKPWEGGF